MRNCNNVVKEKRENVKTRIGINRPFAGLVHVTILKQQLWDTALKMP